MNYKRKNLFIIFITLLTISLLIFTNRPEKSLPTLNNISKPLSTKVIYKPILFHNEKIKVLMYHSIGFDNYSIFRVTQKNFKEQMKYLHDNNYTTLSLDDVYNYFTINKPLPPRSVLITFDDGYVDNYTSAYPILKQYNMKATIFMITNNIDKSSSYLTSNQIKELISNGVDVESHTANHEQLDILSKDQLEKTLLASKNTLEGITNKQIKYIAYPFGKSNSQVAAISKKLGYKMAFTTPYHYTKKSDGLFNLHRISVLSFTNMRSFEEKLNYKD